MSGNSPSSKRYTAESRWVTNKLKAIGRHQRRMEKKRARKQRKAG